MANKEEIQKLYDASALEFKELNLQKIGIDIDIQVVGQKMATLGRELHILSKTIPTKTEEKDQSENQSSDQK